MYDSNKYSYSNNMNKRDNDIFNRNTTVYSTAYNTAFNIDTDSNFTEVKIYTIYII